MNYLRTELAPISKKAWEEIEGTAKEVLKNILTARRFMDFNGPHGTALPAIGTGRLDVVKEENGSGYGIHKVNPLVDVRMNFALNMWELDSIERGNSDPDLAPLEDAARKIAEFEEKAVYYGLQKANIDGIMKSSDNKALTAKMDPDDYIEKVTDGLIMLADNYVEGPYSLIVPPEIYKMIFSHINGYPLKLQIEDILGGKIIKSFNVKDSFLVSQRGGDFELFVGQDLAIGFDSFDSKDVKLYFTESFTFQVHSPEASVVIKTGN